MQVWKSRCAAAGAAILALSSWSGPTDAHDRRSLVVTGMLTAEGAECQALRGDDGRLYTLTGDLSGFSVGDRVRVRGRLAEISFCQQGTTLEVRRIAAVGRPRR